MGASCTPGRRCPPDRRSLSDRRLPLPNGQPYTPLKPPTDGAADNGAYEDSLAFTRPVFPSPVTPGWNGSASAFTLGFAPRSYPQRTPGRGRPHGHWTGSHPRLPTSNRRDHSSRATSRRTAASSFYPTATTAGQWRSFTSIRNNSASRRTFCLVTDLLDHHTQPAHQLAEAYRWRWDGSETALREAKSAIHDAGPATGAILRSATPELIRQEHAAWTTATELVHAATRSAAAIAQPFRKGPRTGQPVAARHLSFTTARRTLIATVRTGAATASLPAPARAAAHHTALAVIATARVTTDRHRHRDHKLKTRRAFPHAPRDITTRTAPAHVHVCGTAA